MKYALDWGTFSPINHIRLINRCYPTNPSEKSVPRSNKLSTLIFYATAKPAKLVKICKYLMHKIQMDVKLNNHGRNKISIDILNEILQECQNFLHLFAVDLLKIIRILLDGDSHALIITNTTTLFIKYCEANHEEILYINDEIMKAINRIHARLAHLSKTQDSKDPAREYEIQCAGLKGLTALASMECFRGVGVAKRIEDFWIAIMFNVKFDAPVRLPVGTNKITPHTSIIKASPSLLDKEFQEFDPPASIAIACLDLLLSQTTSTTIHGVLEPFLARVLDEAKKMETLVKVVETLVPRLETKHVFLLLNELLDLIRSRASHARVTRFFLSTLPCFLKSMKMSTFPIVALVDPLLTIISISDVPEATRLEALTLMESVATCDQLRPQLIHAVSLFARKLAACFTLDGISISKWPLICAKRMLAKIDKTVRLGSLDYEDLRVLLTLCGSDDLHIRSLSLFVIGEILKYSGGLEAYASSHGPFIDLLFGGLMHHLMRNTERQLDFYLVSRCLQLAVHNSDAILYATPHLKQLLALPFPHCQILGALILRKSAQMLNDGDLLKLGESVKDLESNFDFSGDEFYNRYSESLKLQQDFIAADANQFLILVSQNSQIRQSRVYPGALGRLPIPFRDFKVNPASVETSPSTKGPNSVDSDETVETKATQEKPLNDEKLKNGQKPLSKAMNDNIFEFKQALSRRCSKKDRFSGVLVKDQSVEKIRQRNTLEKKKLEMLLQCL